MQRYFTTQKVDNYFILGKDDEYHIKRVMRMKDKDEIEVVYNGEVHLCSLENSGEHIKANILEKRDSKIGGAPKLVLIIPFLKEVKMDLIFQKGTELGVGEFIVVPTERSIVKVEEKKESSKVERWSRICKEASEQSKRTDIPVIEGLIDLKDLNVDGLKIVCSTTENHKTIKNVLKSYDKCDKINIVIGPEGGLTETEENLLVDMGFVKTSLGKLIMRVETVPIYIMSVLNYEMME